LKPTIFIDGEIDANGLLFMGAAPNVLNAENNYWSPNPSANPTLYRFTMQTALASYIGVMGIVNPIAVPYSNCASITNSGSGSGDGQVINTDLDPASNSQSAESLSNRIYDDFGNSNDEMIILYPVPASDILNIEITGTNNEDVKQIKVYATNGISIPVDYQMIQGGLIKLHTECMINGSYFMDISTERKVYHKQFVVLH
jgi:hypothetical protein